MIPAAGGSHFPSKPFGSTANRGHRPVGNLYDPRSGGQPLHIQSLRLDGEPCEPARTNYFAIYRIESGSGTFWADASRFDFGPDSLLFLVPYQHARFVPESPVKGE